MPNVLTEKSKVLCGPSQPNLHGGKVLTKGANKLKVKGNSVLVMGGIEGKDVDTTLTAKCKTPPTNTSSPCASVTRVSGGKANKLRIENKSVMLDTLTGNTNGTVGSVTPQTVLTGTAEHNKLTSI